MFYQSDTGSAPINRLEPSVKGPTCTSVKPQRRNSATIEGGCLKYRLSGDLYGTGHPLSIGKGDDAGTRTRHGLSIGEYEGCPADRIATVNTPYRPFINAARCR